jgi:hypothetical protein
MGTPLQEAETALTQPDTELEPDPQKGQLFDKTQYERENLQIPSIDGEGIDKIRVELTGSIMLDRSEPADVALINRMHLGQDIELRVAGKVAGVSHGYATNREGDLDAIVLAKKVKVETVWVLTPEQL